MVTAKMVKELRERTGAGMMDCKKALTQTDGDMEKAVEFLREKGLAAAAKKAGRVAAEGLVTTYLSEDNKTAVALEVNCETDFVAVNGSFIEFTNSIAKQIATSDVKDVEALLEAKYILDENVTVKEALTALIAKIGENMNIRRFEKLTIDNGVINGYVHGEGRIGVLVELSCEKESDILMPLAKDIAMQVAAANPLFLDETSVDEEALDKEREIYRAQALNEGKPEKIVEKMVEGRLNKWLSEISLVDQPFVRDSDITVKQYLDNNKSTIKSFTRIEVGEGIEKREEDFAEEVRSQMNL